jgi:HEAT repeat protein
LTNNISKDGSNPVVLKNTEYSIRALFNALPYMRQNFQVKEERDFIMAKIFEAMENPSEDIRTTAMQALVEIGRDEYEYI